MGHGFRHRTYGRIGLAAVMSAVCFQAYGNVVGPDTQNFNATPDGLDFVTVQSSEVLRPGVFNLGLFLNHAANTLPEFPDKTNSTQPGSKLKDQLTGADFNIAVGVTRRLQLGLSMPFMLAQTVSSDGETLHGQFGQTGMTEIRPSAKVNLLGNAQGGIALVGSAGFNMIDGNAWTGDGAPPILTFELAADKDFSGLAAGVNLGYRKRQPGTQIPDAPVEPIGDQYIGSVAGSILIPSLSSRLIAELFGAAPVKSGTNLSDRSASSAEALLGVKHNASDSLALHAGGAMGLGKGIASPDWRVYLGLNYTFGPLFEKKQREDVRRRFKPEKPIKVAKQQPPARSEQVIEDEPVPVLEPVAEEGMFAKTPQHGVETFVLTNVMFAFDKDKIVLSGSREILEQLADYLRKEPVFRHMVIEGHTDYIGSFAYNKDLSERRAAAIKAYLVEKLRLDSSKITTVGFGEGKPVADNGNYQGRQLNRRVEFKITR